MKISQKDKELIELYHITRGVDNPSLTLPDLLAVYEESNKEVRDTYKLEMRSYLRAFERGQLRAGQPIAQADLTPASDT